MSQPILAISLFFHLLATVFWIGGLVILTVLVWPESRRVLEGTPGIYQMLRRLRGRFMPISNMALGVLIVTGLFQMTADPNYDGVLQFDNIWSQVMLGKHLTILVMVIAGLSLQYLVAPELERVSLLLLAGKGDRETWTRLRRREVRLTWLNVGLGMLVLMFSAWATSI